MATVSKPFVKVEYEGVNISEDISKFLTEFSYTDNVQGKADEVELSLDDTQGLFQNSWYPDKKSKITCEIQHEGRSLYCGIFFIDEVTVSGPPDLVKWHGVSIDPNSKLRTKKSKGYNQQTLLQIAKDIAKNHGYTVDDGTKTITEQKPKTDDEQAKLVKLADQFLKTSNEPDKLLFYRGISALINELVKVIQSLESKGYKNQASALRTGIGEYLLDKLQTDVATDSRNKRLGASKMSVLITQTKTALRVEPTTKTRTLGLGLSKIFIERSTQNNETDLEYLKRISYKYGLAFNVKPPTLVFYSVFHLKDAPAVTIVNKSSVTGFNITDKIHDTYSDVDVSSHNPITNETISNATELQNTSAEQIKLASLAAYISQAALQPDYSGRLAFIRKAHENVDSVLIGFSTKGFGEQFDTLTGAYANLLAEKTVTACVRFSNICKDLRSKLLQIQAQGNKVTKDKDAFAGGQSANVLVVRTNAEDKEQANAIGKAALHDKNRKTRTGSFSVPGNLLLCAGNTFELSGFGRLNAKYFTESSTHTVSSEYTTSVEFESAAISK